MKNLVIGLLFLTTSSFGMKTQMSQESFAEQDEQ